jgi:hypothetical protein
VTVVVIVAVAAERVVTFVAAVCASVEPAPAALPWLPQALSASVSSTSAAVPAGFILCSPQLVGTGLPSREYPSRQVPANRARRNEIAAAASAVARRDPVWAPQLVVAAAILLDLSLPEKLTLGPTWVLPTAEAVLLVGLMVTAPHPRFRHTPALRTFGLALIGVVSAVNIFSLVLLVHYLLHSAHLEHGRPLILAGIVLWLTNVLLCGPLERARDPDALPDFLFPQMTEPRFGPPNWRPGLIDYLYVSVTNASAFSPTDTMPLTATAKLLMTTQALSALVTVGLVVARAVNILGT